MVWHPLLASKSRSSVVSITHTKLLMALPLVRGGVKNELVADFIEAARVKLASGNRDAV